MAFERFKPEVRRARKEVAQNDYDATRADIDHARPIDTLRTDVTEMLGERPGILEGRYRRSADSIHKKIEVAEDRKDKIGMREAHLRYSRDRTKLKIERVKERMDASGTGPLANQMNRQRRHKIRTLEYKQKVRTNQVNAKEAQRQVKPEQLQKKIDELTKKKMRAVMRKAERIVLREQHGVRKHDKKKRAEVLTKLTPDEKRHIIREAILLVRKQNIERGLLDDTYEVDDAARARKVEPHYERVIE